MGARDRRARILQRVEDAGVVRSAELATEFQVSEMTVRRDLDNLAADNLVVRMRGGAARVGGGARGGLPDTGNAVIGIVFPNADYIYPSVFAAVEQSLKESTAHGSLLFSNYNVSLEQQLVDGLVDNGVSGLLFAPTVDEESPDWKYLQWMTDLPVPVVLVERRLPDIWPVRSLPSVRASFTAGLAKAVWHLASLGHRGIAFFGHLSRLDASVVNRQWNEIVQGFELDADSSPYIVDRGYKDWQSNVEPEQVLAQIRDAGATALICRNDPVALTMVHHARRTGLRIPEDLSVVAYDDEVASMCDPPLTAISPPKEELGHLASRMLLELIHDGRDRDAVPTAHVELEPSLVVRSSTAPPPGS